MLFADRFFIGNDSIFAIQKKFRHPWIFMSRQIKPFNLIFNLRWNTNENLTIIRKKWENSMEIKMKLLVRNEYACRLPPQLDYFASFFDFRWFERKLSFLFKRSYTCFCEIFFLSSRRCTSASVEKSIWKELTIWMNLRVCVGVCARLCSAEWCDAIWCNSPQITENFMANFSRASCQFLK